MDRTERVELTTLVMVTDGEGRMLMQDRQDPSWGGLCFPGGHVEKNESVVRSAIREVQEETGLTVQNLKLCGLKQFPIEGGRYLVLLFRTDQYTGKLRDSREGRMLWLRREELSRYRLSSNFAEMLEVFQSPDLNEMYFREDQDQWKIELL